MLPTLLLAISREERIKIHFLEALERKINFQHEFEKIEKMMVKEACGSFTLEWWISEHFRDWDKRGSYASIEEVRKQLGFQYQHAGTGTTVFARGIDINKYFLYCEMLINIFDGLKENRTPNVTKKMVHIVDTMMAVVEKSDLN